MSRQKVANTPVKSAESARLQQALLAYHHFRQTRNQSPLKALAQRVEKWQGERLRRSYADLYQAAENRRALDFLIEDLYAPVAFAGRDDDLERIFPVIVKLVPDAALGTVADLVELNMLTQELDMDTARALQHLNPETVDGIAAEEIPLTEALYCQAYRRTERWRAREHQIQLGVRTGNELDQYVHSRFLRIGLSMTQGAARMAGLGDLHDFLHRGMHAFRELKDVSALLSTVGKREVDYLNAIRNGDDQPFGFHPSATPL